MFWFCDQVFEAALLCLSSPGEQWIDCLVPPVNRLALPRANSQLVCLSLLLRDHHHHKASSDP